jgi:hypothetical protein
MNGWVVPFERQGDNFRVTSCPSDAQAPKAVKSLKTHGLERRFSPPKAVTILKAKALTRSYEKVKTARQNVHRDMVPFLSWAT